ncbi:hypothetical protein [Hydrogenophaga electricum]|uniref:Uncharacterized protein n=1 Tax=Hydrogenophaga electricum TaxID=1230953 RepID=A0ABQ6C1S1_9BURK|nr:hypothetical protein [Hydrogenophaga electricum]GLS13815.1 hypothetical protein GCM10007935_12450 [Hydrogenophaga electricum]
MGFLEFPERLHPANVPPDKGPLLDEGALSMYRHAWSHFKEDFQRSGWEEKVNDATPTKLQEHGLYGAQLQAKLGMVSYLLERFLATLPTENQQHLRTPPERSLLASAPEAAPRKEDDKPQGLLKRLIEAIDILLDSSIAALGLNGSVTEVKKLLGVAIDD